MMSTASELAKAKRFWNKVFDKEYYRLSGLGLSHLKARSVAGSIADGRIWREHVDKSGG
jgi:hypothetical protein